MSKIELIHGDSLQAMRLMKDNEFDVAIVDPPYGINSAKAHTEGNGWVVRESKDWDKETPSAEYFAELRRISENQIVWGGNYFTEHLEPKMGWIIWNKIQRDFSLADGELAWASFDKAMRIFDMSRGEALAKNNETGGRFHPTQKPVALYKWLLKNYTKEGDTILDTHLGSGSIAIACHYMNRNLVGYEIDKDYYDAACKRFKEQTAQIAIW